MSASANSRLEVRSIRNGLPRQVVEPEDLCCMETITAPATTMMIASHCSGYRVSASRGTAIIATKTGEVCTTGMTRETSWLVRL